MENILFFLFKTGFHYVALVVLELTMETRLALNLLQTFACHYLHSAGIKGMQHPAWIR